jgi:mono/diheme cytochrome c family protein
MAMRKITHILIAAAAGVSLMGCRGEISTAPPVHLVQNMDFQDKLKAQSESGFEGWADKRGMRLPVKGTIARGSLGLHSEDADVAKLHVWKAADGKFLTENPLPATLANIERGRERYNINCSVCHGRNGRGVGIVGRQLFPLPPSFVPKVKDDHPLTRHEERVYNLPVGEMFETITNGKATMQQYGTQVSVRDRWCIIHYIRALQHRAKN